MNNNETIPFNEPNIENIQKYRIFDKIISEVRNQKAKPE
jgi:hypothetical protein